jgi:transcriptional regulator with XRE-family HTH domain
MTGDFGRYIKENRLNRGIPLRSLAAELGIAPAYLCDIEAGHRHPPDKEKLDILKEKLGLSDEVYDLAAWEREGYVAADLVDYIMNHDVARKVLRMARDMGLTEADWERIVEIMKEDTVSLPCGVGDKLYEPTNRGTISVYEVTGIRIELFAVFVEWHIVEGFVYRNVNGVEAEEIGKTVFLTREEAEKELKGR